ncbi:hypothetical protein OA046_02890 [Candidatus Pelagibacter sp.]|nr:hypothetical protein [Candidatus Pelagibacter sp.]
MTNNVLKSAVVVDNYKVYYTFQKKKDSDNLNAMGNFYRFSYQQKQIQNFLESYFIKNGKPKVGDKIYNDTQPAKIEIIQIEENYIRDELEQKLYEAELALKRKNK